MERWGDRVLVKRQRGGRVWGLALAKLIWSEYLVWRTERKGGRRFVCFDRMKRGEAGVFTQRRLASAREFGV